MRETNNLKKSRYTLARWIRFAWLMLGLLASASGEAQTASPPSKEYQIKAAFLFNFSQFVEWPPTAFADAQTPFVIGVLGVDPFGKFFDELVRGEQIHDRPLVVERYQHVNEIKTCHILFIAQSESDQLEHILSALKNRNILTVGDFEGFALRGGMIRFVTEKNKIRFRINLQSAKTAGLTISSKLLRAAEMIAPGKD